MKPHWRRVILGTLLLAGALPEGLPNQEEAKKAVVFAEEIVEFVNKILGVN